MKLVQRDDLLPPGFNANLISVHDSLEVVFSGRWLASRCCGQRVDVRERRDGNSGTVQGLDQVDDTLHAQSIRPVR